MTAPRTYWVGSRFVAEWTLVDVDGGPLLGADVTGVVTVPGGDTIPMTVGATGNVYRATAELTTPGESTYRLEASGAGVDAHEGTILVRSPLTPSVITLDPTEDIGYVRLLITDVNESDPIFTDGQITALLGRHHGKPRLAAAAALDVIARSEVLVGKVISTQGLSTNGAAVAAELRASAQALRDEQAKEDAQGGDDGDVLPLGPAYSFPPPVPWGDSMDFY